MKLAYINISMKKNCTFDKCFTSYLYLVYMYTQEELSSFVYMLKRNTYYML